MKTLNNEQIEMITLGYLSTCPAFTLKEFTISKIERNNDLVEWNATATGKINIMLVNNKKELAAAFEISKREYKLEHIYKIAMLYGYITRINKNSISLLFSVNTDVEGLK